MCSSRCPAPLAGGALTVYKLFKPLRLTAAYCAPSRSELIKNMQNHLVHHLISIKLRCAWCTMQVGGAQCRSVVHHVVLYPRSGAQHLTNPYGQKDRQRVIQQSPFLNFARQKAFFLLPPASAVEVIESVLSVCLSVCPSVSTLTAEPFDARSRNLTCMSTWTISRSRDDGLWSDVRPSRDSTERCHAIM